MAHIVFILAPSVASLNSSLKLAKSLRSAGHHINYVGLADSEELVCANEMLYRVMVIKLLFEQKY